MVNRKVNVFSKPLDSMLRIACFHLCPVKSWAPLKRTAFGPTYHWHCPCKNSLPVWDGLHFFSCFSTKNQRFQQGTLTTRCASRWISRSMWKTQFHQAAVRDQAAGRKIGDRSDGSFQSVPILVDLKVFRYPFYNIHMSQNCNLWNLVNGLRS